MHYYPQHKVALGVITENKQIKGTRAALIKNIISLLSGHAPISP